MMYYAGTRNFQRAYGSLKTKFKIKFKSVELYPHSPYMHYILNAIFLNVDICEKSAKDRFWTPHNLLKCYRTILVLGYGRVPNLLWYGEKACLWFSQNENDAHRCSMWSWDILILILPMIIQKSQRETYLAYDPGTLIFISWCLGKKEIVVTVKDIWFLNWSATAEFLIAQKKIMLGTIKKFLCFAKNITLVGFLGISNTNNGVW